MNRLKKIYRYIFCGWPADKSREDLKKDVNAHTRELENSSAALRQEICLNGQMDRMLQIQHKIILELNACSDLRQGLDYMLKSVLQLEAIDSGGIYIVDPADNSITLAVHHGLSEEFAARASHFAGDSDRVRKVLSGETFYFKYPDAVLQNNAEEKEGLRALAVIPIMSHGKLIAVFNLASHSHYDIPAQTRQLLETISFQIGNILLRLRTEDALRQSEEIFSQFMHYSPVYVFVKDENIKTIRLSENYSEMLGRPVDELLGKSMSELFPPDLAKSMAADDRRVLKEGKKFEIEEELNGRFYSTIKFPIYMEGKAAYLAGITIDITKRRQMEAKLRESVEEWKTTFDSIQDLVMILDREFKIVRVNAAVVSFFKLPLESILGNRCFALMHGTHAPLKMCPLTKMMETKRHEETEIYDEKRLAWFNSSVDPIFNDKGEIVNIVHIVSDITARKQAEEELKKNYEIQSIINYILHLQAAGLSLQKILEKALNKILSPKWLSLENNGAIFLTSKDGKKLILKTQSCLSEYVCTRCREIKFGECMCGLAAVSGKVEFSGCLDERHTVKYEGMTEHGHYCVPIVSNGKTLGIINTYLKPGHIRSKKEEEFLSTMADILAGIIERKAVEQEREALHLQLLKSAKLASIGELSSGLSHEIGNPLQTILGNAELLLMDTQNEELLAIKNASLHCKTIIKNLLDFSKQQKMNFVPEDINKLIEKTLSLYGKQLELKKIRVVKNYGELPKISVSPSHLEQVFLNILINSQNAMPNGGTWTITTKKTGGEKTVRPSAGPREFIEISFKDTGCGISKENLSKLFDPFFTTKKDGTGLGLSVSYGIVKQHGGEILAFSDGENRGAEFIVKLPAKFPSGETKTG